MNKQELLRLLALKNLPARSIEARDPELWKTVLAAKRAARGATATTTATGAAAAAAVAPAELAHVVGADPDLAPLIAKAKLYQIGGIAKLTDAQVEAIAPIAPAPVALTDGALTKLVAARTLTDVQARAVGLAAALYDLTAEEPALAAAIQGGLFARLGGRAPATTRELAAMRAPEWEAFLAQSHAALPAGSTAASVAAALADRFAAVHPGVAFIGRLPRPAPAAITTAIARVGTLAGANRAVVGADFAALDLGAVPPADVAAVRSAHATLVELARAYPGLGVAEILDDTHRTPADRATAALGRVAIVDRVQAAIGDESLLELDYRRARVT